MKQEQIPPEVVEAAAKAAWGVLHTEDEWLLKTKARAAIAAALAAWPDSILMPAELILPLPQEARDAES